MPTRDRAEYMRQYRARNGSHVVRLDAATLTLRVAELEAEVAHLKAELAKRTALAGRDVLDRTMPTSERTFREEGYSSEEMRRIDKEAFRDVFGPFDHGFNSRPFQPVPKARVGR